MIQFYKTCTYVIRSWNWFETWKRFWNSFMRSKIFIKLLTFRRYKCHYWVAKPRCLLHNSYHIRKVKDSELFFFLIRSYKNWLQLKQLIIDKFGLIIQVLGTQLIIITSKRFEFDENFGASKGVLQSVSYFKLSAL